MTEEGIRAKEHLCPKCGGSGVTYVKKWDCTELVDVERECDICHGTGHEEITNEQWFCELSTEEKARFLGNEGWRWNKRFDYARRSECWLEWLKEKHEH